MRLFAAVLVPAEHRALLARAAAPLRSCGADVKWVEEENLHLTLLFLGEVAAERLAAVEAALGRAAAAAAPFEAALGVWGFFGPPGEPRVVWAGCSRGEDALGPLAASLRAELSAEGLAPAEEPGRGFHAHLTVGRVRSRRGLAALAARLDGLPGPGGPAWRVERLSLLRSTLSAAGPRYEVVREAPLGPALKR